MNIAQIEENIQKITNNLSKEEFIYDLLLAYDLPKASITRLKQGSYNLSKEQGVILWKKKLLFKEVFDADLHATIDNLRKEPIVTKHNPRFVVVTDFVTILAYDNKTQDTLDVKLTELHKRYDFFLPWTGREKSQFKTENLADVKAAEKMAKLYDQIRQDNPDRFLDKDSLHELNVFLSRLLFCFFAEDTEIYPKNLFVNSIASHTAADGSDLAEYLNRLFKVLNTKHNERANLPEYLDRFEYVNGGLFEKEYASPNFSPRSRKLLIECGELDWSEINPDIFGSMIQAVVHPNQRSGMGMHYTSVVNIMKVIEPLFLNELYEELEKCDENQVKLEKLLEKISNIRIFDPACGSGNFLIIAYKELRKLEIEILKKLSSRELFSRITPSQFFGIELDDFAHEIATLSLWLAEHQMNVKFNEVFQKKLPSLPLKQGGKIICDNATRLHWEGVCPKNDKYQIYVLGNPPYLGARNQDKKQKEDVAYVLGSIKGYNSLDYIACWLYKAASYIAETDNQCGFVSTNSICQGEQVALLWPNIFSRNVEIGFAHQSFKWTNNAKKNAGVTCVIIGLRRVSKKPKYIFSNSLSAIASNISPYLTDNHNVIVSKRSRPFRDVPSVVFGNQAIEGGHLIMTNEEKEKLVNKYPMAQKFIRRLYGAEDFIKGLVRWCIWVSEKNLDEAIQIPEFKNRFKKVEEFRKSGGDVARSLVHIPYRFRYVHEAKKSMLVLPRTTTERRDYLPIGFLTADAIVTDAVQVIYDPELYIMGILSSRIHMVWVRAVAGRLKTDYRYSNSICYNNFPILQLSEKQKETITTHVLNVLEERESFSEKSLGDLYDPKKMPETLRDAHKGLDQAVERCYRAKSFSNDAERLEYLFKLYEEMTNVGQAEMKYA